MTSAAAASSANTKGSFEGNFFMDFYFSQGDYKVSRYIIFFKENTLKRCIFPSFSQLEAKKTQKEEGIAKQRTKEEKMVINCNGNSWQGHA